MGCFVEIRLAVVKDIYEPTAGIDFGLSPDSGYQFVNDPSVRRR
jgi:hypothetical protein